MADIQPIFIVGTNRSGTTITRNVLCRALGRSITNFEPRLFLSYEPFAGIMLALWKGALSQSEAAQVRTTLLDRLYIQKDVPPEESRGFGRFYDKREFVDNVDYYLGKLTQSRTSKEKWVREFAQKLFETYAKNSGSPCGYFVDDTPSNLLCMPELLQIFPNARIVHSIRDGRFVADSFVSRGWLRGSWELGLMTWLARTETGRRLGVSLPAENYREFDFTNAFQDPTAYFTEVLDFLTLEMQPDFLRSFDITKKPRDPRERPATQNAKFEALAGDLAREFGWPI